MAATKAQLLVWALIFGLIAGGSATLSRLRLPDGPSATATVATAAPALVMPPWVIPAPVRVATRIIVVPVPGVADRVPAAISEFPFPESLATVDDGPAIAMPEAALMIAEMAHEAIPELATMTLSAEQAAAEAAAEVPPIPAFRRRGPMEQPENSTLYVAAETLNVRATPSTEGAVLQRLRLGFAIAPQQRADEWIGFVMKDGSTGWLRTDYLSVTKPEVAAAEPQQEPEPLNLM
jgi:hypothetical protein